MVLLQKILHVAPLKRHAHLRSKKIQPFFFKIDMAKISSKISYCVSYGYINIFNLLPRPKKNTKKLFDITPYILS